MKKTVLSTSCAAATAACLLAAPAAMNAADAPQPASKPKMLSGAAPVNTMVSGGGVIAKGTLLTQLNFSFRDKDDIVEDAGAGARTSSQLISLLKLRYGMTDNVELLFVPGYVYNHRDAFGALDSDHLEGPNDFKFALNWGPWQQKQGDPLSVCVTLGLNLPTGQSGPKHPVGNDVWSVNGAIGITKIWPSRHRIDGAIGFVQPTETGNQGVRKDTSFTLTGRYAYIFNENFDMGLEFTAEKVRDWERNGAGMNNGYTEIYVGPALNFSLPQWNAWVGVGAYFPVMRDYDAPTATDDIRFDFKLGKRFSW